MPATAITSRVMFDILAERYVPDKRNKVSARRYITTLLGLSCKPRGGRLHGFRAHGQYLQRSMCRMYDFFDLNT